MTVKPLADYRLEFAGCEILALVDVSARTVLAWDAGVKWPQEHLDALCALAGQALSIGIRGAISGELQTATLVRATGCHVFVRAAPGHDEVLCGVFAPGADLDGIFDAALGLCAALLNADKRIQV